MTTESPSTFKLVIETVFIILLAVIVITLIMRDEWLAAGVWAIVFHLETQS